MTNNLERATQIHNQGLVSQARAMLQRVRFFGDVAIDRDEYNRVMATLQAWERDLWDDVSGWVYGGTEVIDGSNHQSEGMASRQPGG
jgi:hypothetical protein